MLKEMLWVRWRKDKAVGQEVGEGAKWAVAST